MVPSASVGGSPEFTQSPFVVRMVFDWIDANGALSRVMLDYVQRGINQATADGAQALIIRLNTPGGEIGLMQEMVQVIRASHADYQAKFPELEFLWPTQMTSK